MTTLSRRQACFLRCQSSPRVLILLALVLLWRGAAIAAAIPGLYNTGVDAAGALLPAGSVDPHYRLVQSADPAALGPNAMVVNDGYPINPWLAHGPNSKWIAPMASQATGNLPGDYIYRLSFDLTGLDPDTVVITGKWSSDNGASDIRVNGQSTGLTYDGNFAALSGIWTITQGFRDGSNSLDFVINNAGSSANPTGFRAELSGTAEPLPPPDTPVSITEQPQAAGVELQDPAAFSVRASGGRPLHYQWRFNGAPIDLATNYTFTVPSVTAADAGWYDVVVTNIVGAVTSAPARLTALYTSPPGEAAREPLSASSRRTGLAFSEIMYHPRDRQDGRNLEFIELYNSNPWPEDLSGWRLSGAVDWVFPQGATIAGQGFLVVAPNPADVQAIYGLAGVIGGFTNTLPNNGGTLRLRKRSEAIALEVIYSDEPPWPAAADGAGHSLTLVRPSQGERNPAAWASSAFIGGSPGAADPTPAAPEDHVLINELLVHSTAPALDFIELCNHSPLPVDLSGCYLTDERNTNKFRIPEGTRLDPRGLIAFNEIQLGFALRAEGETIYLVNSNQTRVIDAVRYDGQARDLSLGRFPDGGPETRPLAQPTEGAPNAGFRLPEVVFNEIMFNPISGSSQDEYLELFNPGSNPVSLAGWRLNGGIGFAFPASASIPPGGLLVVANNAARLRTNYANLTADNCLGDYTGTLRNSGERVTLTRPEWVVATNLAGALLTNVYDVIVDEVRYFDKSRWSRYADGGGSSLERIDPRAGSLDPANWADSLTTAAADWTSVDYTGMVSNGVPSLAATSVQLMLMGEGEALVDDVQVIYTGVNRVSNPGFEPGTNGWVFQGTHRATSLETNEGYNSARSLRLRASERGEPIGNRVYATLSATPPVGSAVTLRARVRWLAGAPEFLMRLRGGGIDATARLLTPAQTGTPGASNTRAQANAGPIIKAIAHRPVLPAADQPVRVLARVQDPDGIASVLLKCRLDPSATLTSVPMTDDGAGGDLIAGDGVYTAMIPGQAKNSLVAFRIEAADGASSPASAMYPPDAPARECLIRFGDPFVSSAFANYRFWMTQATLNQWANGGNLSNDPLDITFVYGNSRVVYNAGGRYAASPAWSPGFNSPIGNQCGYDILLPGDDLFLSEDHLSLDIPIRDATNQREQLMHWVADQYDMPNLYRRDVYLFVNGVRRGAQGGNICHDTQQPSGDFLEEWFPDDPDGTLMKCAQWSEGSDAAGVEGIVLNSLERIVADGALKVAAYRWTWRLRASDSQLDYTNFMALVETVNTPTNVYETAVQGLMDVDDWMRMFAMNDLCGYWDALGNPNRKNTYLYKGLLGRWRLIPWDFDVGMGASNNNTEQAGPDAPLFPAGVDAPLDRLNKYPPFLRAYWRELEFGANRIFTNPAIDALLAARHAGYLANGLSFTSPFDPSGPWNISIPAWISDRRAWLTNQFRTVAAPFALLTPASFSTNSTLALIRGTAPVSLKTLSVNGTPYPIAWTTVTNWTLQVPLQPGTNTLELVGADRSGQALTNTSLTVECTLGAEAPEDCVAINEIMYHPFMPEASYIELFNRSTTQAFDLSGWRVNGLDYVFPAGAVIQPRQTLVLAGDRFGFGQAYGWAVGVFDTYAGNLDNGGETLSLLRPGPAAGEELLVDRVTYSGALPWPAGADGAGSALQVIDPSQDNSRLANWFSDYQPAHTNYGWRQMTATAALGTAPATYNQFLLFLGEAGDVYIDDLSLVVGTNAGVGENLIRNGDFEAPLLDNPALTNSFTVPTNYTNTTISAEFKHGGNSSLHLVADSGGSALNKVLIQWISPAPPTGTVCTLSFWYLPTTTASNLNVRMRNPGPVISVVVKPNYVPPAIYATPGSNNFTPFPNLTPIPPLWLSEVQPENTAGLRDNFNEPEPWIELLNAGASALSLEGCYLSNDSSNLLAYAFPPGALIEAGQHLVVWADAQTIQTDAGNLHANFRLAPSNGVVLLSRLADGRPQVLDYFVYEGVPAGRSYGAYPPAQASYRRIFVQPTPGATNNPAEPAPLLFINEWMAANTGSVRDPADAAADDWFELFNGGPADVDLTGFTLTDTTSDPRKFVVPEGFRVPAGGFLLVWADEQPGQSRTNGDLHVNFKLSQTAEAIALYTPGGTRVDGVAFGVQSADVSEGRFPDGSASRLFMSLPTPGAPNRSSGSPAPAITGFDPAPGAVWLQFSTVSGATYRVEYKDGLGDAEWQLLEGPLPGTGGPVAVTDTTAPATQRFYRVVASP